MIHFAFDTTVASRTPAVTPYTVSQRTRAAIEVLDDTLSAPDAPGALPGTAPLVGVLSDVPSMRDFLSVCLRTAFEVVTAPRLDVLAEVTADRPVRLVVSDLYTLEHQPAGGLDALADVFATAPLLVLSQDDLPSRSPLFRPDTPVRPSAVLPLPTPAADIRRMAALLIETRSGAA